MTEEPESTPEAEATPKSKPKKTEYHVLAQHTEEGSWDGPVLTVRALTPKAAVTAFVDSLIDPTAKPGTYVAVPVRNWNVSTVGVETQTKLKFS